MLRRAFMLLAILHVAPTGVDAATSLNMSKGPGVAEVTLDWSGSVAPYDVYRSTSPQGLIDLANRIASTGALSYIDAPPDAPLQFYAILGVGTPFFSEYVEGSASNKALEIVNIGEAPLALATCSVRIYANGSGNPTSSYLPPAVNVAPGDVFVVCKSFAGVVLAPLCDDLTSSSALAFNGDEAVELFCSGTTADVIGQFRVDPGTRWGIPPNSTMDNTLRRRCSVSVGDQNGFDPFDPTSVDWLGLAIDTFAGLGDPACAP